MKRKTVFIYLIILIIQSSMAFGISKSSDNGKIVFQELNSRGGLTNFFEKVKRKDSIKVAYLGGSITAQNGWRVLSLEWFKERFPNAAFTEINAAIGGTGSDFGAFRLHDQVLKYNPDLVFVEFAVNDADTQAQKIIRSMEGIVRQIWQHNPKIDICFVYTIRESFLKTEQGGDLPNSAKIMERVADQYRIPTINLGFEVARMVADNHLIFKGETKELNGVRVFSADGVHPYAETGHVIYQTVLKRSFETMLASKQERTKTHTLHKPKDPDCYVNTKMINFTDAKMTKNWEIIRTADQPKFSDFEKYLDIIGKAGQTGESLTLRFKGITIGAYDFMGPDAGKVIVEIDGLVRDTISRFDAYCTYRRMSYFLIDHLENKEHVATFRVLAEPFDKATILAKNKNVMKNPDDFKENNWYVGKILINGKLILDK